MLPPEAILPLLSRWGQLVFTTRDVTLLDQHSLLRRDQVIFTNRTAGGGTEVYSLWDFKAPRKEANLRKDFLLGRHGAIPFMEDGFSRKEGRGAG